MNDKHKIISTVSLFHAFNDGSLAVIPLLFPIFRVLFDLSYTQIGLITGGGLAITLLTEISVGRAFDNKNSRTLLISGVFLLIFSMFTLSLSKDFLTLLLIVFLIRFSSGFYHPAGIGLISRIFKKDRIDRAMGLQSAFGNFGSFIAVLTTLYIATNFDWTIPIYLWSILGVGCLTIGISLTRHIPNTLLKSEVLKNKKQTAHEAIIEWFEIIKRFRLLIPLCIASSASYGLTVSYLPLFLDEKTTLSLSSIGLIISLWVGIGVISGLFYDKIQSFLRRRTLINLAYSIIGVTSLLLIISTNIPLIILLVILLGFSTFISFPALFSIISEATHKTVEGKTFGYIFTIQLGVSTIFLFLSGVLADVFDIWIPFALLGIIGLIATIMLFSKRKLFYFYN